jgi:hypothetical protein
VFGGWVSFNGDTITDVYPDPDNDAAATSAGRNLPQMRRLWAEHYLSQTNISQQKANHDNFTGILDQAIIDQVHEMLNEALLQKAKKESNRGGVEPGKEKVLGAGTGGWSGVTENGTVLKRDTGNRRLGNYTDRCDSEPGGMWQRGDAEVWITWNGWSLFVSRDGRWRPGYHLEVLLCQWLTVVDYGLTRELFRNRQTNWMRATEWIWVNTPFDIPRRVAEAFRSDTIEIFRREQQRMRALKPKKYVADDASTSERRYQCFQDRGGEIVAQHTVGEGLERPRGLVAIWCMSALNDIVDYERDVLCGESNNVTRGLTSDQQVVDAAAWILEALCWTLDNHDYDLSDAILGSATLYLAMWRYNGPKLMRYTAISVRNRRPGSPPELEEIVKIVKPRKAAEIHELTSYGELYDKTDEKVQRLYGGCTCCGPAEGHDAWKLFAQAMDEGGNDDVEERMHVDIVALNNGVNAGDLKCECGVDLLLYECFVRFFHPETGVVARLHYRSGNTEQGNTVTE